MGTSFINAYLWGSPKNNIQPNADRGLEQSIDDIEKLKCSGRRCKKIKIALVGGPLKIKIALGGGHFKME